MDKICVIIPIYNVEEYLKECLDSVFSQTYTNFDVVLINDGSTDNSLSICETFKSQHKNLILLNVQNGGPGYARNIGIDYAIEQNEYEYIAFIDADDVIDVHYLEFLYNAIKVNNYKISFCKMTKSNNFNNEFVDSVIPSKWLFSKREAFNSANIYGPPAKLFHISLFLDGLRFPTDKHNEDIYIIPKLIISCKKIAFVDCYLYFYRWHFGSRVHRVFNDDFFDAFTSLEIFIDFLLKQNYVDEAQSPINDIFEKIAIYIFKIKHKWKKECNIKKYIKQLKTKRHYFYQKYKKYWKLNEHDKIRKLYYFQHSICYELAYCFLRKKL